MRESIGGFQNATELSHSELSGHLTKFKQNIEELATKSSAFESAGTAIEAQMKKHTDVLLEAGQSLTHIFTEINAWKDNKAVQERIESLQQMTKALTEISKQSGAAEAQLVALQEREQEQRKIIQEQKNQIDSLGSEITNLKEIKTGFASTLTDLEGVAGRLEITESFLTQSRKVSARLQRREDGSS